MARNRTFNPARVGSSPTAPTNAGARRPKGSGHRSSKPGMAVRVCPRPPVHVAHALMRAASPLLGRLLVPLPANTLHEVLQRPAGDFVEFLATHLQAADAVKPEDAEVFARLAPRRYRPRRTPKIERQRIQRPG